MKELEERIKELETAFLLYVSLSTGELVKISTEFEVSQAAIQLGNLLKKISER